MREILHSALPDDLAADARLPGTRPRADPCWLEVDEVYGAQMAYRRHLLQTRRAQVLWQDPAAEDAVAELSAQTLAQLPPLGFDVGAARVRCPDGHEEPLAGDHPLAVLGRLVQEDLVLMERRGAEHVLTAAVLCFPASWTLSEKAGMPLTRIHQPVPHYDAGITQRVQRLFDGVQPGRPLWRNNMIRYASPDLHHPRSEADPHRYDPLVGGPAYIRAERQCIARLPETRAVVFSIHTYVVRDTAAGRA